MGSGEGAGGGNSFFYKSWFEQNISKPIEAIALKLGKWIGSDEKMT